MGTEKKPNIYFWGFVVVVVWARAILERLLKLMVWGLQFFMDKLFCKFGGFA